MKTSILLPQKASHGFTLVEVMIALAISGIIVGAVYSAYSAQQRIYFAQEQVAEMQQNLRAAMGMMVRQIRMAGYDPTGGAGAGITTASVGQISFTQDTNNDSNAEKYDGDTADVGERIDFGFSAALGSDNNRDGIPDSPDTVLPLGRQVGGTGGYQAIAENIQAIEFLYLDATGAVTAVLDNIRSVQISLLARADRADPRYTNTTTYTPASGTAWDLNGSTAGTAANDNFRRRMLITTVQCRNLGL